MFVGSYGLAKLPDTMRRLHGPTKATTLGIGSLLIASMLYFLAERGGVSIHELLITIFLFLTAPVTALMVSKAHILRDQGRRRELPPTGREVGWATLDAPPAGNRAWHALDAAAVLAALASDPTGLADDEAARRLETYGANRLPQPPRRGALTRFLLQFHNLLIYVLLAAGLFVAAIGHATDAFVIVAVVLVNATIGFVQEGRAESALDARSAPWSIRVPRSSAAGDA